MNKPALVKAIVAHLTEKVAQYAGAARSSRAEATDEESKAEDKYDTRGLEAAYLAAGQSRQMAETADALQQFATMTVQKFGRDDPIDLGALVELETRRERNLYFVGPSAGGTEIQMAAQAVLVITPQSPLGRQLLGRKSGDRLKMKIGGIVDDYRVLSVS